MYFCELLKGAVFMKKPSNNDNVIGNSSLRNNNVYDNVSDRVRGVDLKAQHLSSKLGNEGDRIAYKLYCKAFYTLSEDKVWSLYELAKTKGRDPVKYLSWLLSNEIRRSNIGRC